VLHKDKTPFHGSRSGTAGVPRAFRADFAYPFIVAKKIATEASVVQ
jgi:hypothetical protein